MASKHINVILILHIHDKLFTSNIGHSCFNGELCKSLIIIKKLQFYYWMKNVLLACLMLMASCVYSYAQNFVNDSVILGSGAINQSFYSLGQGEVSNISNTDWDLQIATSAFSSSLRINDGSGSVLCPKSTEEERNKALDSETFSASPGRYSKIRSRRMVAA